MLSACEMTNCLYRRRKRLSFVAVTFISNRFPSGLHAHNGENGNIMPGDVNGSEKYPTEGLYPINLSVNSPSQARWPQHRMNRSRHI